MTKIEGEVLSFSFPVCLLLPLSGGSSHDVTMFSAHTWCFHYIHMHLKTMHISYIILFLIYITGCIYWFIFSATCFFFPLICLSSIYFNYWICLFVWVYLPSPSLGIFRLFSDLRYYRYCWNEIHDHGSLCSVGKASRELLGNRACPLSTRYWAICSSWQL